MAVYIKIEMRKVKKVLLDEQEERGRVAAAQTSSFELMDKLLMMRSRHSPRCFSAAQSLPSRSRPWDVMFFQECKGETVVESTNPKIPGRITRSTSSSSLLRGSTSGGSFRDANYIIVTNPFHHFDKAHQARTVFGQEDVTFTKGKRRTISFTTSWCPTKIEKRTMPDLTGSGNVSDISIATRLSVNIFRGGLTTMLVEELQIFSNYFLMPSGL
ncbi:hypothetical protein QBC43DRAFT_293042 [Cladorrhinum sp. PSN259]|nr:hypothetical protein QBC43DRAFT_293042 [Cladorrhinum sp. PSN259]